LLRHGWCCSKINQSLFTTAVAPSMAVMVQVFPGSSVTLSSALFAVHTRPLILIAPFLSGSICSVTTAFCPMSASVFVATCFPWNFLSAMGRVEKSRTHEITTKSSNCHLNGSGVSETKTITNAPHPNQMVVSPIVQDSMIMQMTVTATQNHGRLSRISCKKVSMLFSIYIFKRNAIRKCGILKTVMEENMSTHINAPDGAIAESVLLPGDPLRAKFIAENFLENAECYNEVRGMYGFTGTYKGKRVSVQGTGMGQPSLSIYVNELFQFYNVQKAIRVGTCGAVQPETHVRDTILVNAACSDSSLNTHRFEGRHFAPTASFRRVKAAYDAAQAKGIVP